MVRRIETEVASFTLAQPTWGEAVAEAVVAGKPAAAAAAVVVDEAVAVAAAAPGADATTEPHPDTAAHSSPVPRIPSSQQNPARPRQER
jgi:UDP:flavonoid glycosyltransferase YjiC (YdhE family)